MFFLYLHGDFNLTFIEENAYLTQRSSPTLKVRYHAYIQYVYVYVSICSAGMM
jgi:hypothetical protein